MVLAFVLLILLVAPILGGQLPSFIDNIPGYVTKLQSLLSDPSRPWIQKLLGAGFSADKVDRRSGHARRRLAHHVPEIAVVGRPRAGVAVLADRGDAGRRVLSDLRLAPHDPHASTAGCRCTSATPCARLAREIDAAIAGFVRGQTAVCLILGSFYAVALTLSGLNFGLLIGLLSGLITFIPYVGSMTGLVLALGVAVAQFWPDYGSILIVLGIFLVGQFLEGNVLSPKLVGESVGLHPVWLIFALLAFGYLFGFVGLLVAVPLAATIGVLARFALQRYRESSLYTGEAPGDVHRRPQLSPRQLVLALDHADSFAREDFLAGPSNAAALALVERWPDWPNRVMALVGPEGSGKSHLAAIWAEAAGARVLSAKLLANADLPAALPTGALVLEDLDAAGLDERALFHLINLAREEARLCADHRAHAACRFPGGDPRSRLRGCARCRACAGRAGRRAAARAHRQARRRPAARRSTRRW